MVLVGAMLLAAWYLYEPPLRVSMPRAPDGPVLPGLSRSAGPAAPAASPDRLRLEQERLDLLRRMQAAESESLRSATDVRGAVLDQIRMLEARRSALLEEIARLGTDGPPAAGDGGPLATGDGGVVTEALPDLPAAVAATEPADPEPGPPEPPLSPAPGPPGRMMADAALPAPAAIPPPPADAVPPTPLPGPPSVAAPPTPATATVEAPSELGTTDPVADAPALPPSGILVAGRPASGIVAEPLPAPAAPASQGVAESPRAAPDGAPLPRPPPAPPEGAVLAALPPPPPAARAFSPAPTPRARADFANDVQAAAAVAERRCRAIVVRAQLGEEPSDADKNFLRSGCRAR